MLPPDLLASFGASGDAEISSCELQNTTPQDASQTEIPCQPLDLTVVRKSDSEEYPSCSSTFQRQNSTFLNAPLLKNVPMPVTEIKPFSSPTSKPEDLSSGRSVQILIPPAASTTPSSPNDQPMEIVAADSTIQESKTKVALKFCLKKCGEISLLFRSSSRKVVAPTNSRFQSLMTSLKNTVKSLTKSIPSTNVISQIHNSVMNKLKGSRMQDCVKLFSLTFTPFNKRKKIAKGAGAVSPKVMVPLPKERQPNGTFLHHTRTPELQHLAGFQFAKPKVYECSYCDTKFFKLPIYIKHIRRHAEIIRCDTCWKAFSSVINKRRHQLQCRQRTVA